MSHPSQTPRPRDGEQQSPGGQLPPPWFDPKRGDYQGYQGWHQAPGGGYGYGGQPVDPSTGQPLWGPPPASKSNGLAITSLILGIVGLALSWIPIINYIAVVLGIIGLVLGGIGIFKSHRMMSIAGAVLSLVAIIASFAVFASFANAVVDGVQSAPTAPSLTAPTGGIEDELEGEVKANDAADARADNGWELDDVQLHDTAYDAMTARVTNHGDEARYAYVEVAVLLDGDLVGSAWGVTAETDPGETSTVTLISTDLDVDPTTNPDRLTYELTAQ